MLTKQLPVTDAANIGSYIGVPIILQDGFMFGTLCAIDPDPKSLTDKDVKLLETFAKFFANGIDLEKRYRENYLQEQRLQHDLDLAKRVQRSVLSEAICNDEIDIKPYYQPSEALSGDMYGLFKLAPHKYGIMLIDVMGHGVSASLISMSIRSILNGMVMTSQTPADVMKQLNAHIKNLFNKEQSITTYLTAIYVTVDTYKKEIEFVNAGHPPAVFVKEDSELVYLEKGTLALGIFSDIEVRQGKISYQDSASIFLYTDGLIDLMGLSLTAGIKDITKMMSNGEAVFAMMKEKVASYDEQPDDVCFISIEAK